MTVLDVYLKLKELGYENLTVCFKNDRRYYINKSTEHDFLGRFLKCLDVIKFTKIYDDFYVYVKESSYIGVTRNSIFHDTIAQYNLSRLFNNW